MTVWIWIGFAVGVRVAVGSRILCANGNAFLLVSKLHVAHYSVKPYIFMI